MLSGDLRRTAELAITQDRGGLPVAVAVGFLAGVPRQGRVGVGYSTIYGIQGAPAPERRLARVETLEEREDRDLLRARAAESAQADRVVELERGRVAGRGARGQRP